MLIRFLSFAFLADLIHSLHYIALHCTALHCTSFFLYTRRKNGGVLLFLSSSVFHPFVLKCYFHFYHFYLFIEMVLCNSNPGIYLYHIIPPPPPFLFYYFCTIFFLFFFFLPLGVLLVGLETGTWVGWRGLT